MVKFSGAGGATKTYLIYGVRFLCLSIQMIHLKFIGPDPRAILILFLGNSLLFPIFSSQIHACPSKIKYQCILIQQIFIELWQIKAPVPILSSLLAEQTPRVVNLI